MLIEVEGTKLGDGTFWSWADVQRLGVCGGAVTPAASVALKNVPESPYVAAALGEQKLCSRRIVSRTIHCALREERSGVGMS